MVTLDASQDYYGDLELPPDCSNEDIKRQFRKLALKYHPDRNPGKELECNPRFQAIQSAHEILGDPTQRNKYDISRRKGNTGTSARPTPPRRRDPFPTATNYPPPPRRAGQRPTSNVPAGGANGGAQRYTRFPNPPPPPQSSTSAKQDAKARANMFNAWQSMNHAQKTQAQNPQQQQRKQGFNVPPPWTGPRFKSGNSPTDDPDMSKTRTQPEHQPPRSAYDEVNRPRPNVPNRSNSQRGPPRAGFDPTAPRYDGPQGATGAYNTGPQYDRANRPRMDGFAPQPPPRGQAPTAKRPDPLSHPRAASGDVPFTETSRERTPYMSHVGEKTYFTSDSLRRSESVRDATKLPTQREPYPRRKSTHDARDQTRQASPTSYVSAEGRASASPHDNRPSPNSTKKPTAWPARTKSQSFEIHSSGDETSSDDDNSSLEPQHNGSSSKVDQGFRTRDPSNRPKAELSNSWSMKRSAASPLGKSKSLEEKAAWQQQHAQKGTTLQPESSVFNFPIKHDTFARTSDPEMRSPSGYDLKGVESPLRRSSYSGAAVPKQGEPRERTSYFSFDGGPRSDQPNHGAEASPDSRGPQSANVADQGPSSSSGQTAFAADQWSQESRNGNWASSFTSPPTSTTLPTRPPSNSRRQRVPRTGTAPPTASVTTLEEEENGQAGIFNGNGSPNSQASKDSNAMDIDSDSPQAQGRKPSVTVEDMSAGSGPRPVYVETQRPEWRGDSSNQGRRTSAPLSNSEAILPPPKSARGPQISMGDFRHVPPFSDNTSGGISDLGDLSANLPFESQASSSHPANSEPEVDAFRATLPKPPRPPLPPNKYTDTSWNYYVGQMTTYITTWNSFNSQVISYFQNRAVQQSEMERAAPGSGTMSQWIGVTGDTGHFGGWESYTMGLKDDERVRMHWRVACERHMEAVERHGRLREQIRREMHRG